MIGPLQVKHYACSPEERSGCARQDAATMLWKDLSQASEEDVGFLGETFFLEAVGFFAVLEGFFTVELVFFLGAPFFFTTAADFFLGAAFLLLEDVGFFVVVEAFDVFLADVFAGFALAGVFFLVLVAVLAFFPAVSFVAFFGFFEGSALRVLPPAPAAAASFFTTFIVGFGFGFGAGFFASALSLYELLTCTPRTCNKSNTAVRHMRDPEAPGRSEA